VDSSGIHAVAWLAAQKDEPIKPELK